MSRQAALTEDPEVLAAIEALDDVIMAAAERNGGKGKVKTIAIVVNQTGGTDIAHWGCSCPACAGRMAERLVRAMQHAREKPDEDFGTIVDAAGSVH